MKKYILPLLLLLIIGACVNPDDRKRPTRVHPSKANFILEYKIRVPQQKITNPPLLLLLHGLRSNEDDLIRMGTELDKRLLVVSVRAPFADGNHRYKWFDYQRNSPNKPIVDTQQAEESRQRLLKFIDQVVNVYNVDSSQVFVGGFSQGAMMAYSVGLSAPDKVKGIAAFSGNIPDQIKPVIADKSQLAGLSAFVSHGKRDPVLPYQDALTDKKFLEEIGVKTSFHEYDIMHTMSRQNIIDFTGWISNTIDSGRQTPDVESQTVNDGEQTTGGQ